MWWFLLISLIFLVVVTFSGYDARYAEEAREEEENKLKSVSRTINDYSNEMTEYLDLKIKLTEVTSELKNSIDKIEKVYYYEAKELLREVDTFWDSSIRRRMSTYSMYSMINNEMRILISAIENFILKTKGN